MRSSETEPMKTSEDFLNYLSKLGPRITLIGMSGLGKSHWSTMLEKKGFKRFCCDNLIADRLLDACELADRVDCLGRWMGFPYAPGYKEKEQAYLAAESTILSELGDYLQHAGSSEKIIIDTTGSAPYAGQAVMNRLGRLSRIVHLAVSPDFFDQLTQRYLLSPRPVLWGNLYRKENYETKEQALSRCYPELLKYRESLYRKYAHHTIPYPLHRI
jgi:hypothetical protein